MKVIVGLGNPGRGYTRTPHNIGFEVMDVLAQRHHCTLRRSFRFRARIGKGFISGHAVLLVKPNAYMNNSGPVVASILKKTGVDVQDLIIITDDADLATGQLRIRTQGGGGGHKGMQSLLDHLGQDAFTRIRLGIGRREYQEDLVTHVLTPLSSTAWKNMEPVIQSAADAVGFLLEHGADAAMNAFNARR